MADGPESVDGTDMEQIKIVLNTLYLCIAFAMTHIAKHEGAQAAVDFKAELLSALKSGDLNMALITARLSATLSSSPQTTPSVPARAATAPPSCATDVTMPSVAARVKQVDRTCCRSSDV